MPGRVAAAYLRPGIVALEGATGSAGDFNAAVVGLVASHAGADIMRLAVAGKIVWGLRSHFLAFACLLLHRLIHLLTESP